MVSTRQTQRLSPLPPNRNRGPTLLAIVWTTTALDLIIVIIRIFSRVFVETAVGRDDYTILMALLATIYGSAIITLQVRSGYGRHVYYLNDNQIMEAVKWTTLSAVENAVGVYLVKISVCFFILRIISSTHKATTRVIYAFMVVLTLLCLGNVLLLCLQCIPIEGIWNPQLQSRCISPEAIDQAGKAFSAFGTATDFLCVIQPIFVVSRLQMNLQTKITVSAFLALGLFTAACSIGKIILIQVKSTDYTWDLINVEIWANLEQNLGIIAASLPTVRGLFTRVSGINIILSGLSRLGIHSNTHKTPRKVRTFSPPCEGDAETLVPLNTIRVANTRDATTANHNDSRSENGRHLEGSDGSSTLGVLEDGGIECFSRQRLGDP